MYPALMDLNVVLQMQGSNNCIGQCRTLIIGGVRDTFLLSGERNDCGPSRACIPPKPEIKELTFDQAKVVLRGIVVCVSR